MNLQKIFSISSFLNKSVRSYSNKTTEGIPYYGFTYYPRSEDFKDPPYSPSKLFLVRRIKKRCQCNPAEKEVLLQLQLKGPKETRKDVIIVKNIPQINAMLWKVKHLVDIKPITYQGELPEDSCGTYLRDNGELVISPSLRTSPESFKRTEEYINCNNRFTPRYHKTYLLQKWVRGEYDGE
ncbi:hypothetical protein RUM43_004298 [Polyplax serrata]|uniref:Large ribosomal subunit protein uL30m n=1 Tax=Polyplax serrata TaxID=468196 RepID=A0AAN8SBZ0_POLSC